MAAGTGPERASIIVTNFDSVAQARVWREKGADAAIEQMVAMLRTAVLLGENLQLDRNQVFDGVFFLALGPDRIAAELGLPPGAPLPITITGIAPDGVEPGQRVVPPPDAPLDRPAEVVRRAAADFVTAQLTHVRSTKFLASSSALMAVNGTKQGDEWLLPPAGDAWFPGTGFTDRLHPVADDAETLRLVCRAQEAWAVAIRHGRVGVGTWGGGIDIAAGLQDERAVLERSTHPTPLATEVLALTTPVRKEALSQMTGAALRRRTEREGHVPAPDVFDADEARELRYATELWSRGYYRAIAERDGAMLVVFSETPPSATPDPLRAAYGLELPTRTWWERFRDRNHAPWQRRGLDSMRVDGEILDDMRDIDPGTFRQLTRTSARVLTQLRQHHDPSAMLDLALATREAVATVPSRRRRTTRTLLRMLLLSAIALVIGSLSLLPDLVALPDHWRVMALVASAGLGALAGLPWADVAELFRLRRSSLTATLNASPAERIHR